MDSGVIVPGSSPSSSGSGVSEAIWGPRKTIGQRFPGLQGKLLMDQIKKHYVVEERGVCKFYDDSHMKLLQSHVLNDRDEESTRREYKLNIKK